MIREDFIKEIALLRPKLLVHAGQFIKEKEDAEDIVQEVLLKLYEICTTVENAGSIYALSFTITKHLCLNRLRDSKEALRSEYDANTISQSATPLVHLEEKDRLEHVIRIIDRLPNLQQAILKMRHIEGMSVEEIAEITHSNPEAVRVNLSRARKQVINYFTHLEKL